jgi:hypothetical protein
VSLLIGPVLLTPFSEPVEPLDKLLWHRHEEGSGKEGQQSAEHFGVVMRQESREMSVCSLLFSVVEDGSKVLLKNVKGKADSTVNECFRKEEAGKRAMSSYSQICNTTSAEEARLIASLESESGKVESRGPRLIEGRGYKHLADMT